MTVACTTTQTHDLSHCSLYTTHVPFHACPPQELQERVAKGRWAAKEFREQRAADEKTKAEEKGGGSSTAATPSTSAACPAPPSKKSVGGKAYVVGHSFFFLMLWEQVCGTRRSLIAYAFATRERGGQKLHPGPGHPTPRLPSSKKRCVGPGKSTTTSLGRSATSWVSSTLEVALRALDSSSTLEVSWRLLAPAGACLRTRA